MPAFESYPNRELRLGSLAISRALPITQRTPLLPLSGDVTLDGEPLHEQRFGKVAAYKRSESGALRSAQSG